VQALLWLVAAVGLFAMLFPPSGVEVNYDRQTRGHKLVLSLESRWGDFRLQGDFGALFADSGEVRPDVSFKVDLSPRAPSPFRLETLPQIRFEIVTPAGLRVERGREVRIGDLVAVRDPQEYERIRAALEENSKLDPELKGELLKRLHAQEVRSLLEGLIVHVGLFQDGERLTVVLYVQPGPGEGEGERR
jgi:hypothetical protein